MPSFGQVALPDINPLFDLASIDKNVNTINAGRLANQLASNTLDSNTKIAANAAEGGSLANQYASQRNPLEISLLRQQTGADPSPTLDRLQNLYSGGASAAPIGSFEHAMAGRESSNDPTAVNAGGYAGTFQFGAPRLAAIGAYTPAPGEIDDQGKWNGQMGGQFHIARHPQVKTLQDFLHDPTAQTDAFKSHVAGIDAGIAQTPGADKFDPNGLRAVAHLGGIEGMQKFVSTGGAYNPADSNGTHLSDYYKRFAAGGAPALVSAFGPRQAPPQTPAQPGVALAPNGAAPPAAGPQMATRGPIPGEPATDAMPVPPVPPGAAPQIQNPNSMLALATPDASAPPAPQNALAPPAPAPAPPAAAATGMNSPQVQQAQALNNRAAQIEMAAARTPNDPRAKAMAAAMAADLRGRAAVIMQADSVTVDPVSGVQTHGLTGKQDPPALPPKIKTEMVGGKLINIDEYTGKEVGPRIDVPDARRITHVDDGRNVQVLDGAGNVINTVSKGGYDLQKSDYERDAKELSGISDAGAQAQSNQIRLTQMGQLASKLSTGAGGGKRADWANLAETMGMPDIAKKLISSDGGDAAAAQEFAKMSLQSAGSQERGVLGSRGGYQAIKLFQSANPSLELRPDANRKIINMQLIGAQADADYAKGALGYANQQGDEFRNGGKYTPLSHFDQQWQEQRNPQIYAAAMGALNGDSFDKWTKALNTKSPADVQAVISIVRRAAPGATVVWADGTPHSVGQAQ